MEKHTLQKLTLPKLREHALEAIEDIQGVHGMNKMEILDVLYNHYGIPPDKKGKKQFDPDAKKKLKALQLLKAEANKKKDKKQAEILRKKIHRLKRKTRQ